MSYNQDKRHLRSVRLKGHVYRREGAYNATACVQDRIRLFGKIIHSDMKLNVAGKMVYTLGTFNTEILTYWIGGTNCDVQPFAWNYYH